MQEGPARQTQQRNEDCYGVLAGSKGVCASEVSRRHLCVVSVQSGG